MASNDLMANLSTDNLTKIKKRKIISIRLFDEVGLPTTNPALAHKETILVQNDIAAVSITKDYDEPLGSEDKKAMSIYGYQIQQEGLYKLIELSENEPIDQSIISNLFKITYLDITFQGLSNNDTISRDVMLAILTNFSCVNINNKTSSMIVLPSGDLKLESFSLAGGNLMLEGDTSISSDTGNTFDSVNLYSNKGKTLTRFNLLGNKNYIYNVETKQPIAIKIVSPKASTINSYSSVEASINKLTYDLYDDYAEQSPKEVFDEALLTIMDVKKVKISDITINQAEEFKGICISKCYEAMLSNIIHTSDKGIYGYTIGLSDVTKTYISGLKVIAGFKTDRKVFGIFLAEANLQWNQTLAVSNFKIQNVTTINVGGCKAESLSFSTGEIASSTFIDSDEISGDGNIRLSDVDVYVDGPVALYCKTLEVINSKIRLPNKEVEQHIIQTSKKLKFDNSTLYSEVPIKFDMDLDSEFKMIESDMKVKSFEVSHDSSRDEDLDKTNYIDKSNRIVDLNKSNIEADKFLVSGMYKANVSKFSLKTNKVEFKDVSLSLDRLVSVKLSNVDFTFTDVEFKNAILETRNSYSGKLNISGSKGTLEYVVNDEYSNEDKINVETNISDSRVLVKFDTAGASIVSTFRSDNSIGSTVFGLKSDISVIPSMKSADISSFKSISDLSEKNSDNVNYGNSSEELSVSEAFGLNV